MWYNQPSLTTSSLDAGHELIGEELGFQPHVDQHLDDPHVLGAVGMAVGSHRHQQVLHLFANLCPGEGGRGEMKEEEGRRRRGEGRRRRERGDEGGRGETKEGEGRRRRERGDEGGRGETKEGEGRRRRERRDEGGRGETKEEEGRRRRGEGR